MVLLGTGAGLALPTATGSVVGSVPPADSGVASAADTTAIQLGGALGVAVVGSLLATRYQDRMTGALSGRPLPATVKNSFGGALAAARAGGTTGPPLVHLAKTAFISGMDLGLLTGAVVAVAGCLVALICLPTRSGQKNQLIRTGRGFPVRLRPSTSGRRRRAGFPPGHHQRRRAGASAPVIGAAQAGSSRRTAGTGHAGRPDPTGGARASSRRPKTGITRSMAMMARTRRTPGPVTTNLTSPPSAWARRWAPSSAWSPAEPFARLLGRP